MRITIQKAGRSSVFHLSSKQKNMASIKLHRDARDLADLFGKSMRQAHRKYQYLLKKCKKKRGDLVTNKDIAIAFNCEEAELEKFFNEHKKPGKNK